MGVLGGAGLGSRFSRGLISVGCVLLPEGDRQRFRDEWHAECHAVATDGGEKAAVAFAAGVAAAAPRTAMALRAGSPFAYLEASLALLAACIPALTIVIYSLVVGEYRWTASQTTLVAGLVLTAVGTWRGTNGLFAAPLSRVGLWLVAIGAISGVAVNRLTDASRDAPEPFLTLYPNLCIVLGVLVMISARWSGVRRPAFLRAGLLLTGVGGLANAILMILNMTQVSGADRVIFLAYFPSHLAIAVASFLVLNRDDVLEASPSGTVAAPS